MNGRESCTSLRSMEILSPEPPRELNIPVYGSSDEETVKSSGDKKSKKSKKKKNLSSEESSFQDEKLTRGLAKIQSNDLTLLELRARQFELREETEKIRRENAQGFFKLRDLLGKKGKSVLQDIYFNEYPHLQQLENASEKAEEPFSPRTEVNSAISSNDSNYADLTERIFYQTEVMENRSISQADKDNDDLMLEEEDEELALYLERSERRANFIERNKELAASGDILTKIERERLDAILASDDVDNVDEIATNDSEIRLAQINTELENKFSSTALVPVDIEETYRSEKRLKEIDSRLSFIQSQANLRTGSSQLLAIKDIEAETPEQQESNCNDVSAISKMLAEFQLELERVSLASTCDVMSEQEEEPISEEKIQELLASSRAELNLS